jgi:hypothetical protein
MNTMISDIEEEILDIDWYCVDACGEIAHFASAGQGFLPKSVKASKERLERLSMYFRQTLSVNGDSIVSHNLCSHVRFQSDAQKATYLAFFSQLATKGLYSFACVLAPTRPTSYFQVARPSQPIKTNQLPNEIQQMLMGTCFQTVFSSIDLIHEKEIV